MIVLLAAMAASTLGGLLVERRAPQLGSRLATYSLATIFWVVLPFLTVCSLPQLELDGRLARGLLLGYAVLAICGVVAWQIGIRLLRLSRPATGALVCCAVLCNTGYFGLPFTSTLLGHDDLATAIAYDALVSGPMFYIVGLAIGGHFSTDEGASALDVGGLLRNPPLIAAIVGLLLPSSAIPDGLVDVAHHTIWLLLVFGFVAVGATLGGEADDGKLVFPPPLDAPLRVALLLRLAIAPALYLGLTALTGGAPAAFRIEAAMPVAIACLVVAHRSNLDLRLSSAAIVWSTAIVAIWGTVANVL